MGSKVAPPPPKSLAADDCNMPAQNFYSFPNRVLADFTTGAGMKQCPLYPPKADIGNQSRNVRFVPKADICTAAKSCLFDHLVR